MMKLSATRREFEVADESGYRFKVITEFNPDTGWDAGVAFSANGFKHEADAVHRFDLCRSAGEGYSRQVCAPNRGPRAVVPHKSPHKSCFKMRHRRKLREWSPAG